MLGLIAFAAVATAAAPPAVPSQAVPATLASIQKKIADHWRPVCGAGQPTWVKVRLRVDETGALIGQPTTLSRPTPSPENERAAADAVIAAAPFGPLPARDVVLNFNLAQRCPKPAVAP
jgi:hypothetical protein